MIALIALNVVLLAAFALHALGGLSFGVADGTYRRVVYSALHLVPAALCLLRAALIRRERAAWAFFGVALLSWQAGWAYWWAALEGDASPPYPSPADVLWILYLPLAYAGVVLLVRERVPGFRRTLWLDGLVGTLGLGSLVVVVFLEPVIERTGGSLAAVMTNLVYPLGDVVILAMIVNVCALSRWRPGRSWLILLGATLVGTIGDVVFLYRNANGTFEQGTWLDLTWPTVALLYGLTAWRREQPRELHPRGWPVQALPAVFVLCAVSVLVAGSFGNVPAVAAVLATGTLLGAVARSLLAAAELRRLSEHHERALSAALTDSLTGLRNHRAFHEDLARGLARVGRRGGRLSIVAVDADGLKQVNDTHGHQAGDDLLRRLAEQLAAVGREGDVAYRLGGDEFMVIVEGENAWGAFRFAQRAQANAAAAGASAAAGVAEAVPGISKDGLIRRADAALLEAKRSQRRTVVYSPALELDPATAAPDDRHHLKTLATALARAVDAKDSYTRSHCETVAELCVLIGEGLGLEPERVAKLRLAGLLHDVGKIGVPDAILQKPDALDAAEFEVMKTHARLGHRIVGGAELDEQADWILHHHERIDGTGYPDALAGERIPLESRVILVADAFEAITADRPYRAARTDAEALAELERNAGTQFDATCVAALRAALGERAAAAPGAPAEAGARRRGRAAEPASA